MDTMAVRDVAASCASSGTSLRATARQIRGRSVTARFAPVDSGRISRQIIEQVTDKISAGELRTGDRLPPERELAEQFSVSRVTVRDALRALEAVGLLEIRVGAAGGAFITIPPTDLVGRGLRHLLTMSAVSPRDVAEARLAVELSAVGLAVARLTDSDLAALEDVCKQHQDAIAKGDPTQTFAANFHVTLAAATHNAGLRLIIESFRGPMSMSAIRATPPTISASKLTLAQHRELLSAIRAGDAASAQRVMAVHLMRGIIRDEEASAVADLMRGVGHS